MYPNRPIRVKTMGNQEPVEIFINSVKQRFVKSFLDILILRIVEEHPTWGYDIIKETDAKYQVKLRHGALYPMLSKLEAKGFVKSRKELQKGRVRKIYEVTWRGKQILLAYYDSLREQLPKKT
jgi:PadR family transcriptional regulator PadR